MKRNLIYSALLATIFAFSTVASAQETEKKCDKPSPEKIMEMRAQRMTNSLMLDEATAAKFVPLYKEYMQELAAARPQKCDKKGNELTDADRIIMLEERFENQAKVANLQKKYVAKFAKILSARQVEKVFAGADKKKDAKKPNRAFKNAGKRGFKPACAPAAPNGDCKKGACPVTKGAPVATDKK